MKQDCLFLSKEPFWHSQIGLESRAQESRVKNFTSFKSTFLRNQMDQGSLDWSIGESDREWEDVI